MEIINQIVWAFLVLIPLVLIARSVVAGTLYSPILIIVIFGLTFGYILYAGGVTEPGLPKYPIIGLVGGSVIIVLTGTFFAGGQELRKLFGGAKLEPDETFIPSTEDSILGTKRTQMASIIRAFFILLGIGASIPLIMKPIVGSSPSAISPYEPVIAFLGLAGAILLIDSKDTIANKSKFIRKGMVEIAVIISLQILANLLSLWIREIVALPPIFFVMISASTLGWFSYKWRFGPTMRALLFAGVPLALAGVFVVGGSRMAEALAIGGIGPITAYGFFGQVFWMFGGIALLMFVGRTANVRNLAPGMAGALSHAGLTGACTAGDLGEVALKRAPIMINVPFLAHIFLFPILALSMVRGYFLVAPALVMAMIGIITTIISLRTLRNSNGSDRQETVGLMQFSLGWQFFALFGGLSILSMFGMPLAHAAMAKSSSVSHFGLFAALQGGMFGTEAAGVITLIFALPFLVHPLVFFMFGQGMEKKGEMPRKPVFALAMLGIVGVIYALLILI